MKRLIPFMMGNLPPRTPSLMADQGVYSDGAVQFTAADSAYLSIANNATLQAGAAVNIEIGFWMNLTGVTGTQILVSKAASKIGRAHV